MGSGSFFSKLASYDPLAQALHLPGAGKYMQQQQTKAAGQSGGGPYAGTAPTLAAATAGYAPGGPGSNPDWKPFVMPQVGSGWQRFSANQGNISPGIVGPLVDKGAPGTNVGYSGTSTQSQPQSDAYVQATRNFAAQPRQAGANAYGYGGY